jgi:hypothetical protein
MPPRLLSLIQDLKTAVPQLGMDIRVLPSGVVFLNVSPGRREFVLEYSPSRGFGVSENTKDTPPFDVGHDHVFDDAESAAECLLDLVRQAATSPQTYAA